MSDLAAPRAIHGKAIDVAMADDRAWFEKNPARSFRIRKPFPYEFNGFDIRNAAPGWTLWVLLHQIYPGARAKLQIELAEQIYPLTIPDDILRDVPI
jgi:hypothetical protein